MDKLLDLRFVIGLFFLIVGVLLLGYSFLAHAAEETLTAVNRWCGIIFIVFGILMSFVLNVRSSKEPTDDTLV